MYSRSRCLFGALAFLSLSLTGNSPEIWSISVAGIFYDDRSSTHHTPSIDWSRFIRRERQSGRNRAAANPDNGSAPMVVFGRGMGFRLGLSRTCQDSRMCRDRSSAVAKLSIKASGGKNGRADGYLSVLDHTSPRLINRGTLKIAFTCWIILVFVHACA
jgi:hypothetical protein